MKFNIDNYDSTYVMHCPTEEAARTFLSHLDSLGKTWYSKRRYTERTNWGRYKSQTCYRFTSGLFESLDYHLQEKVVLEFYDFDWDDDDYNPDAYGGDTSALEQFLGSFQVNF